MWISDFGMVVLYLCACDTMGERIRRIGRMDTDFLFFHGFQAHAPKKSVCICPIRLIRSPIVSQAHE
jgi:hypothetical protein